MAYITRATDGTYTHFNELNGSEKYNADGYILERRNEQGIRWTFHYTNKLLQRVVHSSGREVRFLWTGRQVTTVIAPNTHSFNYTYTPDVFGPGHGRLASATVPAAPAITTAYHYEDARFPDALTGKTINGQRYSWFTYHANGRTASTRHSGDAEKYTFTYDVLAEQSVLPPPAPPPPGGYGSGGSDRGWCEFVPGTGEICYNPMSMPPGEELQGQAATSQTGPTKPRASRMRVTTTNPLGRKTVHLFEDAKLVSVEGVTSPHCQARYRESEYDSNGYPNLVTDYKDGVTDFDYDAQDHLLKMVEAVGKPESRTTLFVWDVGKNRVTRETLVGEFQRDYLYNAQGRVTSVTVRNLSPNGVLNQSRVTTFTYAVHANGLLASVTEDGPLAGSADSTTRAYDSQGNLISLTNGLNHKVTYSGHDGLGLPARSIGANGAVTDYLYDGIGRLMDVREHVDGAVASTGFDYDGSGLLVAVTTPDGHVRRTEYDAARRPTMEFEQTDTGYDVRSYEYNAMSMPTVIRTGTSEYRPDTRIHGTIDGISESGGSHHVTGWACSLYFNPSINVHVYVGGPAGSGTHVTSAVANKASESAVAQACKASGTAYRFSINLESMRAQHGGKLIHIHGISPVGRGNGQIGRSGQFRVPAVQTTPPTLPPDPECPPGQQCVPRIIVPGDPQGDQFEALAIQVPYGTVETVSYIDYDEEGRVRARRGNDGQHVRYVYDANDNVEYVIDSLNRSTHYEYDALDRLVRTTDAKQGVTGMTYDRGDRVTSLKDARGNTTTYTWDGFGQLWSQNSPDTGVTAFGYNATGQRTSLTRNDGSTLAFEYDTVGRLKKSYAGLESRAYWYDNCLPHSPHTGRGQLCRIETTDAQGSLLTRSTFQYSPRGQLVARHDDGLGADDVTWFGYDLMGRIGAIVYPSGHFARYGYHRGKVQRLTVQMPDGTIASVVSNIEHQPFGGIKGWTYGNGLKRLQGYDLDGRLNALSVTAGSTVRQSLTYAWTANDQIEAVTNGVDATQSHRYEYDELGRLVGDFIGGATVGNRDGFDAVGNRTSRGSTTPGTPPSSTYAISPVSNRMDSQSGNANRLFGYSPTGQLVSSSGWQGIVPITTMPSTGWNRRTSMGRSPGTSSTRWTSGWRRRGRWAAIAMSTRARTRCSASTAQAAGRTISTWPEHRWRW